MSELTTNQLDVGYGYMSWHHDPPVSEYYRGGSWWRCGNHMVNTTSHEPHRRRINPGDGWEIVPEDEVRRRKNEMVSVADWEARDDKKWTILWYWQMWTAGVIRAFRRPIISQAPIKQGAGKHVYDSRKEWVPRSVRMPTEKDGIIRWSGVGKGRIITLAWRDKPSDDWTHWRCEFEEVKPEPREWEKAVNDWCIDPISHGAILSDAWLAGATWARDNPELAKEIP